MVSSWFFGLILRLPRLPKLVLVNLIPVGDIMLGLAGCSVRDAQLFLEAEIAIAERAISDLILGFWLVFKVA